jgi:murein tripeptide amidase MpaA
MSLPPPGPQGPESIILEPSPRLASPSFASNRPKSTRPSSVSSRPFSSLLPVPPLPAIFTHEDLARELELLAKDESDDDSSDDSSEGAASPIFAKKVGATNSDKSNDPVKLSDPFYSAKSATGFEEAAANAESTLAQFDKISMQAGDSKSKRRDALVQQIDIMRQSAERARNGFSICYDAELADARDAEDVGIVSLMHYSGRIGDSIIFSCRGVECGNLHAAMREKADDYLLKLSFDRDDHSTSNGWFCFSMRNLAPNRDYKFCIINMNDNTFTRDHLGCPQFKLVGYSSRQQQWKTVDAHVALQLGSVLQPAEGPGSLYLTFSMTVRFTESWVTDSDDSVTLAAAVPYSQRELASLVGYSRMHRESCSVSSLCRTPMGNDLVAFTITAPATPSDLMHKRTLIFCARAHACADVTSSWVAHGMVAYLCSGSADARALLQQFVFVIIPLMNPDGVAAGHSHLSASCGRIKDNAGGSLWNAWAQSKRAPPPEVLAIKLFVRRLMDPPGGVTVGKASSRPRPAPLLFCELATEWGSGGVAFVGVRNGVMSSAYYLRERTFPIAWAASASAAASGVYNNACCM